MYWGSLHRRSDFELGLEEWIEISYRTLRPSEARMLSLFVKKKDGVIKKPFRVVIPV